MLATYDACSMPSMLVRAPRAPRSRKGQDLVANNAAAFAVYWEPLQRQVRS